MSKEERPRPVGVPAPRGSNSVVWQGSANGFPAPDPNVTIIFRGLQCFFFDGDSRCDVGIHNTTQVHAHPQQHDYVINVWKKVGGQCPAAPFKHHMIGNPKFTSQLEIDVTNPADGFDGVYVYENGAFTRSAQDDPQDWRWVIDFDDLYHGSLKARIDPDTLTPGVTIKNGLFYTMHRTNSTFHLHDATKPDGAGNNEIGSVAEIIAANIYLNDGGKVTLSGGPFLNPFSLDAEQGVSYQIDITNLCDSNAHPACDFKHDPQNSKEVRSDFYLYYKVFDQRLLPSPEYELIITQPREATRDLAKKLGVCPEKNGLHPFTNDDTPCGGVTFGQTVGP